MRPVLAAITLAVLLFSTSARAQDLPAAVSGLPNIQATPVTDLDLLRRLSARLDALQTRLDLQPPTGAAASSGIAFVDVAVPVRSGDGTHYDILVGGWGLVCETRGLALTQDFGRPQIVVDGIETGAPVTLVTRTDVVAGLTPHCERYGGYVPLQSGISARLDARIFGTGPFGTGWHEIKIRVYDLLGRARDSDVKWVLIPVE